jgi:hypothetical protein
MTTVGASLNGFGVPAAARALLRVARQVLPAAFVAAALLPPQEVYAGSGPHQSVVWSRDGERIEISHEGEVEFTDDDTDIKRLSPGGYLKVSDGGWFGGRGVEIRADASGALTRRYRVAIVERPFEPDGRAWLARTLPRFIRESGLGAPARVARLLKAGGPSAVLAEIGRIEGGHGKRIYFAELLKVQADPALASRALIQASREIASDYELASLLIDLQHLAGPDETARAYFGASSTIDSDYELRRVLSAVLKAGPATPPVLAGILTRAPSIESDFELASLLVEAAKRQPLDATTRGPFFAALDSVESDYEHGRVLSALSGRPDLTPETLVSMLRSSAKLGSDYERAQFLSRIARIHAIEATLRPSFFTALDGIESSFEKARVLEVVVRRRDTDADTVTAALRSAASVASGHERMQVLLAAAGSHPITGAARAAYIQAAEPLGDHEQGQVLSALVRNERARSRN